MIHPENLPRPLAPYIELVEVALTIRAHRLEQITENSKRIAENFAEIAEGNSYYNYIISEPYYLLEHKLEYLDFYSGLFAMREGFYFELCQSVAEMLEGEYLTEYTQKREKIGRRWYVQHSLDYLENFSKSNLGFDKSQQDLIEQGKLIRNKITHEAGMLIDDLDVNEPLHNLEIWESYAKACREMLEAIGKEMTDVVEKVDAALPSLTEWMLLS